MNGSIKKIGLAVSGGADSTALLILMAELQTKFDFNAVVLHVDHGLRIDSAQDAEFVRSLAKKFSLPFHALKTHVKRRRGESLEMAARRVRLAFFEKMTKELALDAIATGHHADDVAETFIMRMARGAGADGLGGLKRISHVGSITFIRPLLDLRDSDLRNFLRLRNITWHEDSSNTDETILRNKVRRTIIPWLRENLDPHITEHICKSAAILRGDLTRDVTDEPDAEPLSVKKTFTCNFTLKIERATGFERRPPSVIGALPAVCEMSRRALGGRTLEIRKWKEGDRIAPTGMNGKSRKLQDVFVTAKVPTEIRQSLPVLTDKTTNEVLWVPGYRIAQSVAVENDGAPSWRLTLASDNQSIQDL